MFSPVLPFSSERLHIYLGYDDPLFGNQVVENISDSLGSHYVLRYLPKDASGRWEPSQLAPGTPFQKPEPLFRKLDADIVDLERARLEENLISEDPSS